MTLRRRVLGYLALATVASCLLTVGVAVVLVRHQIAAQRARALVAQANLVALAGGAPGALNAGQHVYRVGSGHPVRVGRRVRAAVLTRIGSGDGSGTITINGHGLLYVARTTAEGRVILVRSARLAFAEWRPFLSSLVLAGLGGIVLAVLLSALLARRLTLPIGRLAAATRRLASGEPGVTVPVEGSDELAGLGRSFNAMSGDLARARESERAFLESVSHELKTPLTSIRGYAEAVGDGAIEPKEAAGVIFTEAGRLERLVFDLLDLARVGRAGFDVEHRPVDLTAVGAEAVRRHAPRAEELGVTLRATPSADGGWGAGDEGRLLQATSNLIENAIRLTPAGGSVTVAASPGEITVADTGPGLAEEDLPRAFERFYLYDRYRSERAVGSGLGLAIVKQLTAAMGGGVSAHNRPQGGAVFTISVPRATPEDGRPAGATPGADAGAV